MDKETAVLKKRITDLANQSYRNNMFTFTSFLSLAEQQLIDEVKRELGSIQVTLFGGNDLSERAVARFGNPEELGYEENFPIVCVHIKPLIKKFADSLSHRDFLGALMNLGIERSTIGDINVRENECYLFCLDKMASYICDELTRVKHTSVMCSVTEIVDDVLQVEPTSYEILVSSNRIDGVVSKVYNLSRAQSVELFRSKRIYVNGRCQENNSYFLKEGETVTVRGFGKFVFIKQLAVTKKEKLRLEIGKYEG